MGVQATPDVEQQSATAATGVLARTPRRPLSQLADELVRMDALTPAEARRGDRIARTHSADLRAVLHAQNGLSQLLLARADAQAHNTIFVDPSRDRPDPAAVSAFGVQAALQRQLLPWRWSGDATVVLTARPLQFARHLPALNATFGSVRMAVTTQHQIDQAIADQFAPQLARAAEQRLPAADSSRDWNSQLAMIGGLCLLAFLAIAAVCAPMLVFVVLCGWVVGITFMNSLLKLAALLAGTVTDPAPTERKALRLPTITLLVPLFEEKDIAAHLIARLKALNYPRYLLDVCLVLEAGDDTTRHALGHTQLPTWIRPVTVPAGTLKTKPRALNYALDFARGSIIGVYDAEDAPDPGQLHTVAHRFANSGPDVACLQGTLDYYNPAASWLSRCFCIEYAGWFRVVLPGLARLGLVVPLGGTTLFFRREVLEKLGGWDAHNVTEDADLGVRLARRGYITAFIPTVTEEEANGRLWPWVKQRSRWLKGYAVTYGVHMRNPLQLWRNIGAWRFFGLQLLFLGTLTQFVLAPVLWSFWLIPFGLPHPAHSILSASAFWTLAGGFIVAELINLLIACVGVRRAGKSWLMPWAPTLMVYFPLGSLAVYKGLIELAWKPFYWDKTAHGVQMSGKATTAMSRPQPHPASVA